MIDKRVMYLALQSKFPLILQEKWKRQMQDGVQKYKFQKQVLLHTNCTKHFTGWVTAQEAGTSQIWFPVASLELFIDLIFPDALRP
jgi:hypothetical protein